MIADIMRLAELISDELAIAKLMADCSNPKVYIGLYKLKTVLKHARQNYRKV